MLIRTALPLLCTFLFLASCSKPKPIVVGSKDSPEQQLLAEITAQHLEKRLNITVVRRLGGGDTRTVHQLMLDGAIGMYPEYSGIIASEILREIPSPEPSVTFERVRQELKRREAVEILAPFGFNSPTALVIRAEGNEALSTVTDAAASPTRWKLGVTYDFQTRSTGFPALNIYRLEMGAPPRGMNEADLFRAFTDEKNPVTIVTATLSDGHLTQPAWKALRDDRQVFAPAEAAILVRDDILALEPNMRGALSQLTGKISLEKMRQLNARVVVDERPVAEVAAEFLNSAGLN